MKFILTLLLATLMVPACSNFSRRQPASKKHEGSAVVASETTNKGSFDIEVRWGISAENGTDILEGKASFIPSASLSACSKIGFVQIAKVTNNQGENYQWSMAESPRNLIATTGHTASAGFYVDHLAGKCKQGESCSPYFADYWPNEGQSAFGSVSATEAKLATLADYPFGWSDFRAIELEACAVCADSQENYGCVHWGASWPATEARSIAVPVFQSQPSKAFQSALANFHFFYQ